MKAPMLLVQDGAQLEGMVVPTDDSRWLAACRAWVDGPRMVLENWDYSPYEYPCRSDAVDWIMSQAAERGFSGFHASAIKERG